MKVNGRNRKKVFKPLLAGLPATLYKFRDWNNPYHQDVLLQKQLFASDRENLNDPYDSSLPVNSSETISEEAYNSIKKGSRYALLGKDQVPISPSNYVSYKRMVEESNKNLGLVMKEAARRFGILSFASNKENILLW